MYNISRITSTYESTIKTIREINEALKQLCEETKDHNEIRIIKTSKYNEEVYLVMMSYEGNNVSIDIKYMELINILGDYYRYYPNEPKNLDIKDKIIRIIETRVGEAVTKLAYIVK